MVVLDVTIVNIALPSAQKALGLLERRAPVDRHGVRPLVRQPAAARRPPRRPDRPQARVSSPGPSGFAAASAVGGLAQSFGVLVVARAVQGGFAALLAPAALGLLTTTFIAPSERKQGVRCVRRDRRLRCCGRPDPRRGADRVPRLALVHVRERDPRRPHRDRRAAPPRPRDGHHHQAERRRPRRTHPHRPAWLVSYTASPTPRRTAGARP